MKLMGGSSTRRPPPPALPPPRPVMVVVLYVGINRNEAWGVERRPFEIESQVLEAGGCRVELVTVLGWCCAQPVAKFRAGPAEMPARREMALKLLLAQTELAQPGVGSLGPPCYPLQRTCSCKQRVDKQQGDKDPLILI